MNTLTGHPVRLLLVGFGDVATRLVHQLQRGRAQPWALAALVRSESARASARGLGIRVFDGDLAQGSTLDRACAWSEAVIHLAPPPNQGAVDLHTRNLLACLGKAARNQGRSKRLVYVSTTGVYGDAGGASVWETTPLAARTERALRRVNAEQQLRRAAKNGLIRLSILRAPGIYAAQRLPLERLKAGTPALLREQDMWTNHIHADDLAAMTRRALFSQFNSRVYNAVDFSQMKMGDYFDAVADHFAMPRPPRLTRAALAERVSPMMLSFMSESRRMVPTRIVREWKFRHGYPTVTHFLASLT